MLLFWASFALLVGWLGCTAFNDAELPVKDGGAAGGDGTATNADTGCVVRIPTDRPPETPPGTDQEIVFAVRQVDLGLVDGGLSPTFGYDIDNACTCEATPAGTIGAGSCVPTKGATGGKDAGKDPHCDGEKGRDDETGSILAQVSATIPNNPAQYANDAIDGGFRGILLRVSHYTGEATDAHVDVAIWRSPGPYTDLADGGILPSHPATFAPSEKWAIDSVDVDKQGNPQITAADAFVKDHTLIASLQTSVFPFNTDADLKLSEVTLSAHIEKDKSDQWQLTQATAIGRWSTADALVAVGKVQDPGDAKKRLCQNQALFDGVIRGILCNAADITRQSTDDNKSVGCNALSTAIAFIGSPATLGAVVTVEPNDPCAGITISDCTGN